LVQQNEGIPRFDTSFLLSTIDPSPTECLKCGAVAGLTASVSFKASVAIAKKNDQKAMQSYLSKNNVGAHI
jgi:hypothetical protein